MKSVKFGFNTIKLHINIKIFCFILQGLFELINYLVFKLSLLSIFYSIKVKLYMIVNYQISISEKCPILLCHRNHPLVRWFGLSVKT